MVEPCIEKEIRGSFIHYTLYPLDTQNEPWGFLRVTPAESPFIEIALNEFYSALRREAERTAPRITSA